MNAVAERAIISARIRLPPSVFRFQTTGNGCLFIWTNCHCGKTFSYLLRDIRTVDIAFKHKKLLNCHQNWFYWLWFIVLRYTNMVKFTIRHINKKMFYDWNSNWSKSQFQNNYWILCDSLQSSKTNFLGFSKYIFWSQIWDLARRRDTTEQLKYLVHAIQTIWTVQKISD